MSESTPERIKRLMPGVKVYRRLGQLVLKVSAPADGFISELEIDSGSMSDAELQALIETRMTAGMLNACDPEEAERKGMCCAPEGGWYEV